MYFRKFFWIFRPSTWVPIPTGVGSPFCWNSWPCSANSLPCPPTSLATTLCSFFPPVASSATRAAKASLTTLMSDFRVGFGWRKRRDTRPKGWKISPFPKKFKILRRKFKTIFYRKRSKSARSEYSCHYPLLFLSFYPLKIFVPSELFRLWPWRDNLIWFKNYLFSGDFFTSSIFQTNP